ncbi:MAG: serine/threonine protein kinase [Pirellulales bacterium]|nr:serine/threonine protein kinase [Pirellulales bacterium]
MAQAPHSILEQAGLASGLLSQEQIDRAWHAMVDPLRSGVHSLNDLSDDVLSERLVELGYLNRWQAEQLRHGRTKFTLGPYRILDAIGHGGMGYVFKGEHVLLGRIEAIKVLPKNQMDPASVAAFCREIRSQAQLDHPNLVRLSFADKEGDTYFLVTEFVPGSDLRRLVRHHGPLAEQQAAVVISQAAEALAYAHDRGLVHRDVKPGNLLVTPAGRTKLTDLGLAAFSSDAAPASDSGPKHIVGTPDFIAPEAIIAPGEVRRSSDIYSLGCTLYYAVTGKVPYPGGATRDKLRRHLEESPITPLRFAPQLDAELVDLVAAMMRKRPDERVGSAQEVVARLRRWTAAASENTWKQIGLYAAEPGEPSLTRAPLADTIVVEAEQVDTGEQTPSDRAAIRQDEPFAGQPLEDARPVAADGRAAIEHRKPDVDASPQLDGIGMGFWPAALVAAVVLLAVAGLVAFGL